MWPTSCGRRASEPACCASATCGRCPTPLSFGRLADAAAVGVLEQDISFGGTGTVYANVLASLARAGIARPSANFIGGLGGGDISREAVRGAFARLEALAAGEGASGEVVFLGIEEGEEDQR